MNARQLEIFHAVMHCRTITEAARFLKISQPAVSKAIRVAEQQLGFRLLRSVKGRLYPTPEAESLLVDANRIMRDLAGFQRLTAEMRTGRAGLLRFAASSSLGMSMIPAALARFRQQQPGVRISSHLVTAAAAAELVTEGRVDFGVTLSPVHAPATTIRSLAATEMICIMPEGHALQKLPEIHPTDLLSYPLISFGSETHFGRLLDEAFAKEGVSREVTMQVTMSLVAASYVQRGAGVAIVDSLGRNLMLPGIGWRPFRPRVLLPVNLVTSATQPLSRFAGIFIGLLQEALEADRRAMDGR